MSLKAIKGTPWEITRIARCGGLSKLNREQRRYARGALQTMLDHGGLIHGHRCHTNARVLALTDFLYGCGRIAACSGTVSERIEHSWCEIDGAPFEITYPLGGVEHGFRAGREFTLDVMRSYKKTEEYKYSQRPLPESICDVAYGMMHPVNSNLPPAAVEAIVADLVKKRGWMVPSSFPGALAKIGEEVSVEHCKTWHAPPLPGEDPLQFVVRADKEDAQLLDRRLRELFDTPPPVRSVYPVVATGESIA